MPRTPKPRVPSEPQIDELDATTPAPQLDPTSYEDDSGPDPASSMELTSRRPLLEPDDVMEHELTLQTRIDSPEDSFAQMTFERVQALSHPGDEDDEPAAPPVPHDDDEPAPLGSVPHVPKFSDRAMSDIAFLNEPTALTRPSAPGVEDRPMTHVSPAERGLLAAMSEGHEPSRLVYADWLARRGEVARAEFLRLDHTLAARSGLDDRFARTLQRLREIAPRISVDWRSRVARSSIEGCAAPRGQCPGEWRALPADRDDVRTCAKCTNPVYYCASIQLAQDRVQRGERVAIDITCHRLPGDLGQQCTSCQGHVPPDTRFCPHCGRPMHG